jgi:hypothetical protein
MATPREPQDRQPAARKRAPAKTVQRKPTRAEMAATDETEGLRTEADAEDTGHITVDMDGYTYRILPREDWRTSTTEDLQYGRVNDWAEAVMPAEDFEQWLAADPTGRQVGDFFEEMGRVIGVGLGESRALRRVYLRGTRRQ